MEKRALSIMMIIVLCVCLGGHVYGAIEFGPLELISAGGSLIDVPGYSVPSYVDWNSDGLNDLVVGEGGGGYSSGKVGVYLNNGTANTPQFSTSFFAEADGLALTVPASGCLGAFPRVVYWDGEEGKDLLVGQADGKVKLFSNTGTNDDPSFGDGKFLKAGPMGSKTDIDVGYRATLSVVDWNNDGSRDLAIGAMDGKLRVYINEGTDTNPDFASPVFAQNNGSDLVAGAGRLSPVIVDLDGDGRKDLLAGDTTGKLSFYSNVGTDDAPVFAGYEPVLSDGSPIDLPGSARSRPSVCDWTGDGNLDILVGGSDGQVYLYQGIPEPATLLLLGAGALILRRRK